MSYETWKTFAVSFIEYTGKLKRTLAELLQSGLAVSADLEEHPRGATLGYVRGSLHFFDSSELHYREYLDTGLSSPRLMYVYHYQNADQQLIFRYDNAAHRPPLAQLEHKHTTTDIELDVAPSFDAVIQEIVRSLPDKNDAS